MNQNRTGMTRKDMALEMIREKRSTPVRNVATGDIYASIQEAADELGVCRQYISQQITRARNGKPAKYVPAEDWEPYEDLKLCQSVDEYVLHYIRLYYPELYEDSLHVVRQEDVRQRLAYHEAMCMLPLITIEDGHYYDVMTEEELGEVSE